MKERFGSHSQKSQEQARLNAAEFVRNLATILANYEDQGGIEARNISETTSHPQFSALLQGAIINAAQTDNAEKHELLAKLIASRLGSEAESTLSLASSMASDAIARSTKRQIELLALLSFILEVRPKYMDSEEQFRDWLKSGLAPFSDFEFHDLDAWHLVAISCATYNPESHRDLDMWLGFKWGPEHVGLDFSDLFEVEILKVNWDLGLAGMSLTSVGSIVGSLAFDQLSGSLSGMPVWED